MRYIVSQDNYHNRRNYEVGIYCRLSREEGDTLESNSIQNQKSILTKFVIEKGWNIVNIYVDDGFTGLNFDRPAFNELIEDIKKGKITLVITKDLSRLGRDYIEVGYYIEKFFPENGVRYIALNDNIDTEKDMGNNDIMPFKSIINDMYSKDISKKVRSVFDNKRKEGLYIGSFAPFGYLKSEKDKNKLIIDEVASVVVKRIFDMYLSGYGLTAIARKLNSEGIDTPSEYKRKKYGTYNNGKSRVNKWCHGSVKSILTNPVYYGCTAQNKYKKINYKSKKLKRLSKESWIIVENTHTSIISKEQFLQVQELMKRKNNKYLKVRREIKKFSGFVFCGTCGEYMTYYKTNAGNFYLICSGYKRYGKKFCSRHSILEDKLEKMIVEDFKKIVIKTVDKNKLKENVQKEMITSENIVDIYKRELVYIDKKLEEIKNTIMSLYKDKVKGIISEEQFLELNQEFNQQRASLIDRQSELSRKINEITEKEGEKDKVEKLINSVINLNKLNRLILTEMIDKIEIFEDEDIKIYYKFKLQK